MKQKILLILLIVTGSIFTSLAFSEDQSSSGKTYEEVLSLIQKWKNPVRKNRSTSSIPNPGPVIDKCGLGLMFDIINSEKNFSEEQKQRIQQLLASPTSQKNRVIGRFMFFYDTTGIDAPTMLDANYDPIPNSYEEFVDSAGQIFNYVWNYEIGILGYEAPPLESANLYPVFISDLGTSYYGLTVPYETIYSGPPSRSKTYIEIDNSFSDVYASSRGIPGLKVTAAHEFHHAVQIGSYGYWSQDHYFYEISAVWMEDQVYNEVNDYIQYLSNFLARNSMFSHPEYTFTRQDGEIEYSRGLWGKYLEEKYSPDMIKKIWEYARDVSLIPANNLALNRVNSSFKQAFLEFSFWNLNTGPTSDTSKYYSEGNLYPTMRLKPMREYSGSMQAIEDSVQSLASVYYPVCARLLPMDSCGSKFEMRTIITNINTSAPSGWLHFRYLMNDQDIGGSKHLSNGVYVNLEVNDPANWSTQESVPSIVNDIFVYPNPFLAIIGKRIYFRLPSAFQSSATLTIFSSSMDKMFSGDIPIEYSKPLEPCIAWNGFDENGYPVSSGIYFYFIQIDDKEYQGKFAVVRK